MPLNRVTVHDVARLAGVSTATVSRALTGTRHVTPSIAERVRSAASDLGYETNLVGRSLRRRVTETLGLVIADITNPFFPALVQAIEEASSRAGYSLVLADAQNDVDVERQAVSALLARDIDALLISPCHRKASQVTIETAGERTRVVQVDRFATRRAHFVGLDQRAAIHDITAHLDETGRRHPVFIGSDTSVSTSWERQRAYTSLSRRLDPSAPARVLLGDLSVGWGRSAALTALRRWPGVDALICANDLIAVGAVQALARHGVSVPDKVSVSGFDDTLLSSVSDPAITTVRQPINELATIATALAVDSDTYRATRPVRHLTRGCLIVRASSRPTEAMINQS